MAFKNQTAWSIWLISGLFYLYEFIHRVIISVMVPELMHAFDVSSTIVSSLSASYFFAFAFAQIPVGLLIDRYGNRLLLTLACLTVAVGSYLFANTHNVAMANYYRSLIGLGSAFAFVGCLKLAAAWFPANKFAFIVGLTNLLSVVGALIGGHPSAYAVEEFGWRPVMLSLSVIGIVLCICLWHIVRDNNATTTRKKSKLNILLALTTVVRNPQAWLVAVFAGCMVAPIITYAELWGVSYLMQHYYLDRLTAAKICSLIFVGIAIGGPTIGWLSDYIRNRTLPMLVGLFGALIMISIILFLPSLPLWLLYALHIFFGMCTSSMLLCFSINSEATTPNIRATTVAFTNSLVMLIGATMQTVSGALLDYTYNVFALSFLPLIGCYLVALVCFRFIAEPPFEFRNE